MSNRLLYFRLVLQLPRFWIVGAQTNDITLLWSRAGISKFELL